MFQAPTEAGLPPLSTLLDDVPGGSRRVARHLGISESTLQRYRRANRAPRAVMLALFWESRWGVSLAHSQIFNDARAQAGLAASLADELARTRAQLDRLLATYHAPRAANDPLNCERPADAPVRSPARPARSLAPAEPALAVARRGAFLAFCHDDVSYWGGAAQASRMYARPAGHLDMRNAATSAPQRMMMVSRPISAGVGMNAFTGLSSLSASATGISAQSPPG